MYTCIGVCVGVSAGGERAISGRFGGLRSFLEVSAVCVLRSFLGFWGFGVLGFWGFGVLGVCVPQRNCDPPMGVSGGARRRPQI